MICHAFLTKSFFHIQIHLTVSQKTSFAQSIISEYIHRAVFK